MISHPTRRWIITMTGLLIFGAIVYFLYVNSGAYLRLLRISVGGVAALVLISLASPIINGLTNAYLFQRMGASVSHWEGILLAGWTSLANQLPIPGGFIAKGLYLKYKHDVSYGVYFSAMLALFFCSMTVDGLIGLGVIFYWHLVHGIAISPILTFAFSAMACSILVFVPPWQNLRIPPLLRGWLTRAMDGWNLVRADPRTLIKLIALQTTLMLLLALRYWTSFHMLSQNISPSQALLLACASILTQLVSIAPGGLGVQEAIVGAIVSILGFELAASVAAVELDRVAATTVIVITGWISMLLIGKQFLPRGIPDA
jgi:uncharacterized membrane protein YbhN (UPF0104 family)